MRAARVSFCLGWLLAAGCCHLPMRQPAPPPPPLPQELSTQFNYPRTVALDAKEQETTHRSRYEIKRIEMAALPDRFDTNRLLRLDYYAPHREGRKPVVLVLPISGGGYPLEKHVSAYFARRGWAAVIVRRRKLPREPVNGEELSAVLGQSIIDARRALDWIETRPELDATKIGVFGVSMGGIKAALLAPVDKRVQATVSGLAGGDIPYILRHTTEPGIMRRRERILKEHHLQLDEFEARLRAGFACDPNMLGPYVPRDKVLLVLACFDRAVPIRKGRELRDTMGRPETIFLPTGHYSALLCLSYLQHESFKFLRKRLYSPQPKESHLSGQRVTGALLPGSP